MKAMEEPEIRVEHRDTLSYLLTEAAEIEHGLMCCYLYAAHSIGAPARSRQSQERAALLGRWTESILSIARDEMVHLALVSNISNAIGLAPHLRRPNFPVAPGYHPSGVVVSLAPFSLATLDHFVYLERPEGVERRDGEGFRPRDYVRGTAPGRVVASAQDYMTVGHLYRGIRSGLARLADAMGERALFCGDRRLQVAAPLVSMPGLSAVTDLASAQSAVDTILEQGEGTEEASEDSHYCRFLAIRDQLEAVLRDDPGFDATGPVASNPVMRRPPTPAGLVWVNAEPAAFVLDVGNALYILMVRALRLLFSPAALDPVVQGLAMETALSTMAGIAPVAELLTQLPANPEQHPGVLAGLTYTMPRAIRDQVDPRTALRTLGELTQRAARGLSKHLVPLDSSLTTLAGRYAELAERCLVSAEAAGEASATAKVMTSQPSPAPPSPAGKAPPASAVEEARGKNLLLRFEAKRCIHARHCVLGAPRVFLANVQGQWLFPDEASVESLVAISHACPSGAITYQRFDGGANETPPPVNLLRVRENGPYALHADLRIASLPALTRATLCRCGASKNKPFCDGSHTEAGFAASGEPATQPTEPLTERAGVLTISPQSNGPLAVSGPLEICAGTGRTIARVSSARLCRCGGSSQKPFCDGTHARIGFVAPG